MSLSLEDLLHESRVTLIANEEQLKSLSSAKEQSYLLDNDTIDQFFKTFKEQEKEISKSVKYCDSVLKNKITELELGQLMELKNINNKAVESNKKILGIIRNWKDERKKYCS